MGSQNDSPGSGPGKDKADTGRAYTTSEVSVYCRVSPNTVGRWFTEGRVPFFKTAGGRRRVWGKDLASLMGSLNIPIPRELRDPRPPMVLIVDDEAHARRAIKRWITQDLPNVQVEEAVDGFDAGHKLAELVPAVVILDIVLPGIDGLEVCRRIRSDENLKAVRILAISGHDAETAESRTMAAGADAFLAKPLEMDAFISRLRELLPAGRRRAHGARGKQRRDTLPHGRGAAERCENTAQAAQPRTNGRHSLPGFADRVGQELAIAIFKRLNGAGTGGEIVRDILACVRRSTGLEAAGIRVKAGEDHPYYGTEGFPEEFAAENNSLCARQAGGASGNVPDACLCDRVLRGRTDPALPFFTKGGSFWTNRAADLPAAAPGQRQADACGRCLGLGYASVALIPLRSKDGIIGLLQLCDRRRDRFTPEMIEFFEGLGASIAIALDSRRDRESLQAAHAELLKTRDELALALAAKSEFLANMSHELRTPLNSIIGFSEVLQDGAFGPLNAKQGKYVSNILASGRGLLALINDILSLARLESGDANIETEKFGLAGLLEDTLVFFREKAMRHNIALSLDAAGLGGGVVETDRLKLQQVLVNIISNAVKYTPDGGKVEVKAAAAPGGFYEISVADTGIGMKPEDLKLLFSPFPAIERVYTKRYAGAGVGLAIAKKLAELLGGTISARSEEGKGSLFILTVPAERPRKKD